MSTEVNPPCPRCGASLPARNGDSHHCARCGDSFEVSPAAVSVVPPLTGVVIPAEPVPTAIEVPGDDIGHCPYPA
jgi:hypothetical protein